MEKQITDDPSVVDLLEMALDLFVDFFTSENNDNDTED